MSKFVREEAPLHGVTGVGMAREVACVLRSSQERERERWPHGLATWVGTLINLRQGKMKGGE